MSGEHHDHPSYVKIWAILLALLGVSIAGPELGIKVVTLITAFGIAVVKAWLVAKHFMHINLTARYVPYLVVTGLVFMLLFFAGSAPDVMEAHGTNWEKPLWEGGGYNAAEVEGSGHHEGAAHH